MFMAMITYTSTRRNRMTKVALACRTPHLKVASFKAHSATPKSQSALMLFLDVAFRMR